MNIQTLSDTELNRAMIWLYPPSEMVEINYLTDWNLTMPLAVKEGLDIAFIIGRASCGASFLNNYVISVDKKPTTRHMRSAGNDRYGREMTKTKGNQFANAYHQIVIDLQSGRITKAIYDMLYVSLNAVYETELVK